MTRSADAKNNARRNSGFTLVELLAAIVVMAMISLIIGAGLSGGARTYRISTFESNGYVLRDTINTALAHDIRFCDTSRTAKPTFSLSSGGTITTSNVYIAGSSTAQPSALLNESAYSGLKITNFNAKWDNNYEVCSGSYNITDSSTTSPISVSFSYKNIYKRAS